MAAFPIMVFGGVALGIVLLAARFVLGWVSAPAAIRFDRAVRATGTGLLKLVVVVAAAGILAAVWSGFRG